MQPRLLPFHRLYRYSWPYPDNNRDRARNDQAHTGSSVYPCLLSHHAHGSTRTPTQAFPPSRSWQVSSHHGLVPALLSSQQQPCLVVDPYRDPRCNCLGPSNHRLCRPNQFSKRVQRRPDPVAFESWWTAMPSNTGTKSPILGQQEFPCLPAAADLCHGQQVHHGVEARRESKWFGREQCWAFVGHGLLRTTSCCCV